MLYHIYPRSFADSDGDGVGDLPGITSRLDHLAWLGIDAIWLSPTFPSPNADWGYDVADYYGVHPELGTLDDLDRLVVEAGRRELRVLLDLVPNHTSDRHPWFVESRASRQSPRRSWYVWADPASDGSPPNNWVSVFGGGPAWTLDDASGQYYHHAFLPEQPDLNWWSDEVRDEFDRILGFWFDRGVAGVRIDVAHKVVKDRELRDNPPAAADDPPWIRELGQHERFTANQPGVHDVFRRWRRLADGYEPRRLLLGETYVHDLATLAQFYGRDDELHLAFNFLFVNAASLSTELASIVEATEATLPNGAWPVWTASNHDAGRFATRWCADHERQIRCVLLMLLTLRGTPVLYYGDEIGMANVDIPADCALDPVALRGDPSRGRDQGRTPMQWEGGSGAGFTRSPERAWLPIGDAATRNVAAERDDAGSTLHFCRDAIALRRSHPALRRGDYEPLRAPDGVWAWRRGGELTVALNLSEREARIDVAVGRIALATRREREGEEVGEPLLLHPWEGVVVGESRTES